MATSDQEHGSRDWTAYTNYVAYRDPAGLAQSRIGHLNLEKSSIQPLSFESGAPLEDLYQVIEIGGSHIKPTGAPFPLSSVELLAPISGRDILAVGKNYFEHAIEFNTSGYDSSDVCSFSRSQVFSSLVLHYLICLLRMTSTIESGSAYSPCDIYKTSDEHYCSWRVDIPTSRFYRNRRL